MLYVFNDPFDMIYLPDSPHFTVLFQFPDDLQIYVICGSHC